MKKKIFAAGLFIGAGLESLVVGSGFFNISSAEEIITGIVCIGIGLLVLNNQ